MNGYENDVVTADIIEVLKIRNQLPRNDHVTCISTYAKKNKNDSHLINKDIPADDKFDWRDKHFIRPVLFQGHCLGCWAISIVETMESMAAIRGIDTALTALSVQQLIDCSKTNHGCDRGDVKKALKYLCGDHIGITTAKEYPNTFKHQECKPVKDGKRKIAEYWTYFNWDETEMTKMIFHHGPLIVVVNADPWVFYTGGVIQNSCSSQKLNHVVQVVGYDLTADPQFYIIRNSWGEDWGIGGYAKLAIGSGLCGVNREVSLINVV
ncbi:hypothetical protein K1T71_011710 [Dendrolimus kikuchii]|uniref:Uncharacterized protein n=1 Tax=Dendrolimus kikuchii TaxID=765133 RepID=A0ACC1CM00_9NEOP|nr:hypothetical protein K1T71_011710 [Dendrolimus kikuchii]